MLGQRIVYYLQVNGDRFLIGRYLGTTALGTYAVAYNTMLVPASKIGGPLQRVFSPAFSRIQDDPERIAATWARVVRVIGLAAIPSLGGLIVVAPDFVPVVLGSQWKEAVPVVQILAWVGIIQAVQGLNYDVLMARGRARTMFRFSIVLTACHLAAFGVGLQWGVVGVAVGYAISTTLVEPIQTLLAARCLGVSPMVFVRALSGVVQATSRCARSYWRFAWGSRTPAWTRPCACSRAARRRAGIHSALPLARARDRGRGARAPAAPPRPGARRGRLAGAKT